MKKLLAILVACLMPICLIAGSGDVNGDGKIDVADIVELLNHLNGNPTKNYQATEADANNDGVVDNNDVKAIADKIMTFELKGNVILPDGVDNKFLNSCQVVGISDNYKLQGNSFKIYTNPNGLVQTFFLSDDKKTYMACRLEQIDDGQYVTIDVETSAMALATLHPLFAPCKGSDYYDIYWRIKSSSKYWAYYQEVENTIKTNKDLFDGSNETLINSLDELYDDVLSDIDLEAYQNASTISLSRGGTRAPYESSSINPAFFYADFTGNTLTLQCRGLTPSYYGTVTSALTGEVRNYAVTSRSDYGGMEIFKAYDQIHLGDKCPFKFTAEGEHKFSLSRNNVAANVDFYIRLANSLLNIIGINFGDQTVIREIAATISNALLDAGMNCVMTATGIEESKFMDWFGVAYQATIDYLRRESNYLAQRGLINNLLVYAWILNGAWNIYGKVKGTVNIGARIAYYIATPENIEFCLCYYGGKVYDCVEVYLSKLSGDKQEGKPNRILAEPIKVEVQSFDHNGFDIAPNPSHVVTFEVVSGGGRVLTKKATIDEYKTAGTFWVLGKTGEQKVKSVVYDLITQKEICEPVYFTASIKEDDPNDEDNPMEVVVLCPDNNHPHMIDLGLPSGTKWSCCNVGASQPEEIGGYYTWGDTEEGNYGVDYKYINKNWCSDCYGESPLIFIGYDISGTSYDVATEKMGSPWCMPSKEDGEELVKYCDGIWKKNINGVSGYLVKSLINGNYLLIPEGGYIDTPYYYYEFGAQFWLSSAEDDPDWTFCKGVDPAVFLNSTWNYARENGIGYEGAPGRVAGRNVRPVAK